MAARERTVVLVRHRVANYRRWKDTFDADRPDLEAHGCTGTRLFRFVDRPNELVLLLSCRDPRQARELIESEDLRDAWARSGVTDRPDVYLLEELAATES